MNDRDYLALFSYFVGARGEHAVHVRALIHAGFAVSPDPDTGKKSFVHNPNDDSIIGVVLGEPEAVIGWFKPEDPKPEVPLAVVNHDVVERIAGAYDKRSGW